MKLTLVVLSILYLSLITLSCSSEPQRWYKPGGTVAMYERDKTDCEDELLAGAAGGSLKTYTFEGCMEMKGWVVLEKPAM